MGDRMADCPGNDRAICFLNRADHLRTTPHLGLPEPLARENLDPRRHDGTYVLGALSVLLLLTGLGQGLSHASAWLTVLVGILAGIAARSRRAAVRASDAAAARTHEWYENRIKYCRGCDSLLFGRPDGDAKTVSVEVIPKRQFRTWMTGRGAKFPKESPASAAGD